MAIYQKSLTERGWKLGKELPAAIIVTAAVTFNFVLAFLNANAMAVNRGHIVIAEVLIVGAALGVSLLFWTPAMRRWMWLMWFMIFTFLIMSVLNQDVNIKLIRDVIIMPIFVMLGMCYAKGNYVRLIVILQTIVLGVMVFEGLAPDQFGQLLDVRGFYVNTRDFMDDQFWNEDSNLFISASRPNDRFLMAGSGLHRLSSIHLEPVTLGNWSIIIAIFILAFRHKLSWPVLIYLLVTNLLLLIGCDGRLATVTIAILAVASLAFPYLPRKMHVLYLPLIILISVIVTYSFNLTPGPDDFSGRVAGSIEVFTHLTWKEFMGISIWRGFIGADSGISYITVTQSIFGFVVIWMSICLLMPTNTRASVIFIHATALYVSFTLMVSFSLFSIKSAGILWFLYGMVARQAYDARSQSTLAEQRKKVAPRPQRMPAQRPAYAGPVPVDLTPAPDNTGKTPDTPDTENR